MADVKPLKLSTTGDIARFTTQDVVPVEHGGTGVSTLSDLTSNLLPVQTGHGGEVLTTDGSGNLTWTQPPSGITVSTILGTDLQTVTGTRTGVTTLRFDTDAGFDLTDLGDGSVKVGMNSTFKYITVDGQPMLTAFGLDTLRFIAGENVTIATDNQADPQSITISAHIPIGYTGSQGVQGDIGYTGSKGDTATTVSKYNINGPVIVVEGALRWYPHGNIVIDRVYFSVGTAGAGTTQIDVKKNNSSIFVAATPPSVSDNEYRSPYVDMAMPAGPDDFITVDILSAGEGTRDAVVYIVDH